MYADTKSILSAQVALYDSEIARLEKELSTARAAVRALRKTLEQLESLTKEEPHEDNVEREGMEPERDGAI